MRDDKSDPAYTVCVVDDDPSILQVLEARLVSAGYAVLTATDGHDALERLTSGGVDLVVTDVKMPGMGGLELLARIREQWADLPVIMLTAFGTIPDAVASMKDGAADYLTKPFDGKELLALVARLLDGRVPAALRPASAAEACPVDPRNVIWGGASPAMEKFYSLLQRVAPSGVNVLLTGESGTGKELAARYLHQCSPCASGPFVVVDCGSTPATLLESELFGHVKGSFTHAVRDKKGLIEEADGGTLFLDEIGNISPEMQTRLLRFLQEGTIRRIGSTKEFGVSCRVIAATNADLPALVRESNFREDLYFRLKVVTVKLPPLRDRAEDIPLLVERFVSEICNGAGRSPVQIPAETMRRLQGYAWPGNVRELKHAIEAGVVLCNGDKLMAADLQLEEGEVPLPSLQQGDGRALTLEESEHKAILRALEQSNWVQKAAADLLGISRRAIHYKIKKYDIRIPGRSRAHDEDE